MNACTAICRQRQEKRASKETNETSAYQQASRRTGRTAQGVPHMLRRGAKPLVLSLVLFTESIKLSFNPSVHLTLDFHFPGLGNLQ